MSYQPRVSYDSDHPRKLIPKLCRQFYNLGWFYGQGGGISISVKTLAYTSPSPTSSQNFSIEKTQEEDLFVHTKAGGQAIEIPPKEKHLKVSDCMECFLTVYNLRKAGAVIHTHSKAAVMATLLFPGKVFECNNFEMLKGIWHRGRKSYLREHDHLMVPIIENGSVAEVDQSFKTVLKEYGDQTQAVLIRRHGILVWGETWQEVKTMTECYDYLFDITARMKMHGLDTTLRPEHYELRYTSEEANKFTTYF